MRKLLRPIGYLLVRNAYPPLSLPLLVLRFFTIIRLSVLSIIFVTIHLILEFGLDFNHKVSVSISFLILPLLYLILSQRIDNSIPTLSQRKGIPYPTVSQCDDPRASTSTATRPSSRGPVRTVLSSFGGLDRGFVEGLFVYLLLTGWVFYYYLGNEEYFSGRAKAGWDIPIYLFLIALNVMPVDFYSKRFIQFSLRERYGALTAILLQTVVWLLAHIPESLWLDDLMGWRGVWAFLLFSGVISGVSYERTKNVSGLMVGHVMLNGFVVLMAHM